MKVKVVLDEGALMPTRAHELDAGYDLYARSKIVIPPTIANLYHTDAQVIGYRTHDTGVHIQIPEGYVGFIKAKSGLNVKHGLTCTGVIDSGYTGSICVKLYNNHNRPHIIMAGEKIAQLVLLPIITPELEQVDSLEETERGNNGFGSTGK